MLRLPDRRSGCLDRRSDTRGGRRITDREPHIAHGLLCQECDLGVAALVDSGTDDAGRRLMYRCPQCGLLQEVVTADPQDGSTAASPSLDRNPSAA